MDSLLLDSITKDFLNQDTEVVEGKKLYRMGWAGSMLSRHAGARERALLETRERLGAIWDGAPRLEPPVGRPEAGFRPARYFFRGIDEFDRRKNPAPIVYLLTETNETSLAKPVPGNSLLFRSLCKGKGVLRRNKQGMIYLDIDNRFISMLQPYLKAYGLERPPYFNLFTFPDGAHVPVIPAREAAFQYLDQVDEMDREFSFEIEGLYSVEPTSWPEVEQVWFFKLRSPELETLRRKYFLPALPGGHAFHIAVAVKPRVGAKNSPRLQPLMRVNVAFIAA